MEGIEEAIAPLQIKEAIWEGRISETILLVELDHAAPCACRAVLEGAHHPVYAARNIADAQAHLDAWASRQFPYVVIAHAPEDRSWIDLTLSLRSLSPRPEIALLSTMVDQASAASAEAMGAWPLVRPGNEERLIDIVALLRAHRNRRYSERLAIPATTEGGPLFFGEYALQPAGLVTPGGTRSLRPAEYRVLAYIVCAAGRIVPMSELAHRVLSRSDTGLEAGSAVRRQIANLRASLGPFAPLVETVPGYGYRLNLTATNRSA